MDTFMNVDSNQATSYGEYPVSSSVNAASSSTEAFQTSTEGLGQYEANTNDFGLDTQINADTDFQSLENENDFASVNLLSSNESTNVQVGEYPTTTSSTGNVDFTASTQIDTNMNFDTNAQVDFGTTNATSDLDILAKSSTTEAQYGEYQASSPIIDTAESAKIVEDNSTGANFNFDAGAFRTAEPNVEMENNNFDFTASNSIIGSTSALNNIDSNTFATSEPIVDSSSANFDINNINITTSIPTAEVNENVNINTTMPESTYESTDLIHELVDPNPIETDANFSTQQININEYQNVQTTFDTTTNVDMNTFGEAEAVEAIPSFDATAFASTEQTVDTSPAFDTTAFTQSEPVVDTTPAFDTTAFTQTLILPLLLKVSLLLIPHQPLILPLLLKVSLLLILLLHLILPLLLKVSLLLILLLHLILLPLLQLSKPLILQLLHKVNLLLIQLQLSIQLLLLKVNQLLILHLPLIPLLLLKANQ